MTTAIQAALTTVEADVTNEIAQAKAAVTRAGQNGDLGQQEQAVQWLYAATKTQEDLATLNAAVNPPVVTPPVVTPPVVTPPATGKPVLGFYGNGGGASNATATAKLLGVTAQGCSNYCNGSSWATIEGSSWTQSDANPLQLFVGVNLCPDNGNLTQAAPAGTFSTLAKAFKAGTIARPGWEFDGNWFTWGIGKGGKASSSNTPALYIERFQACVTELRASCPGIKIDWCGNSGSSTLAQLEAAYPGDAYVDIIGFDHYDAGSPAANLAAVTPTIQFAAQRNKPIGIGEWGAGPNDDPAFIDFMALLINHLATFCAQHNLPVPPGVAYSSLFTDSSNNITNKPNMIAEFPKAWAA